MWESLLQLLGLPQLAVPEGFVIVTPNSLEASIQKEKLSAVSSPHPSCPHRLSPDSLL